MTETTIVGIGPGQVPVRPTTHQVRIFHEIVRERIRQDTKWGPQSHPSGTGEKFKWRADVQRARADKADADGRLTWFDILAEEFWEGMAEEDRTPELRNELIQVIAVALCWIEDLDRKAERVPL